ncbi:S-adenosyl-L-methionine-dependent methyltransferase [Scheffersomyces amazonensis]|uniref:S-adenosyl-L-methionine-dependent methyltransferase n=1 Tax=Scheffersomyces amazonensis TaxID=1078765 RepID=UPI00315DE989
MLPTPIVKDVDYEKVYEPAEDSFLLLDCLEEEQEFIQSRFKNIIPIITEIGGGSGIVTTFLHKNILPNSIFITTDINPHACEAILNTVKVNKIDQDQDQDKPSTNSKIPTIPYLIDSCQMDLTSGIKAQEIDLLVFNPPYVPAEIVPEIPTNLNDDTWLDLALMGGEDGMITTWKILDNLHNILNPLHGVAYILFCARNKPDQVAQTMTSRGWNVETVILRKAGWEVLSILKFTKTS